MSDCKCFECAARALIHERYPDGIDNEAYSEVLTGLANIVGHLLACGNTNAMLLFGAQVAAAKAARDGNPTGVTH